MYSSLTFYKYYNINFLKCQIFLIPVIDRTDETNIIPPQDLRPHAPVIRNQQGFVGGIITNYCNSVVMIFACVPNIHNDWITLINLAANSLITKSHALEIPYTCFCGRDNAILTSNFIKDAANKPRIDAFLAGITILASNFLNCGINLCHRFSMCKIKVNHRSKRRQSTIIIFTIVILVKTTKIFELNCQAALPPLRFIILVEDVGAAPLLVVPGDVCYCYTTSSI
nr:MAG TPA: hypothetical protein [Caudoviricetes sp.]